MSLDDYQDPSRFKEEQAEVVETKTEKSGPSELDRAAYDLEYVMPKALSLAANMKAGALNRVFSCVLQYPIIKNPKHFKSRYEEELFFLSLKLLNSKALVLQALKPQLADVEDAATDAIKDELLGKMKGT